MKRSSSPLLLWLFIIAVVLALFILQQNGQLTLPNLSKFHLNLKSVPALAQSIDQAQTSTSGPYSVVGKPTISAAFIDKVLASAGSPAVGTGQALYDDGVSYGVDPVFALAFFQHESGFGRYGWAKVNHSLGNIRCTPGYACQGGYRSYSSWAAGYADWYALIKNLYIGQWHLSTVAQIVPTYAPTGDHNDPTGYIQAVENSVKSWRSGRV